MYHVAVEGAETDATEEYEDKTFKERVLRNKESFEVIANELPAKGVYFTSKPHCWLLFKVLSFIFLWSIPCLIGTIIYFEKVSYKNVLIKLFQFCYYYFNLKKVIISAVLSAKTQTEPRLNVLAGISYW